MDRLFTGKAFQFDKHGDVGVLTFDLEGERVNKLGEVPMNEMDLIFGQIKGGEKGVGIKALLIRSGKKNSFIVGADINSIQSLNDKSDAFKAGAQGQAVYNKLEDLGLPTLVAIDGPSAGGGTELALACQYRIASDSEKTAINLPEVRLGFLPGWGGTWRLPRKVGLMAAVDMMLTGKSIRADKALKMGLVDAVVPAAIFEEKSLEFARLLAQGKTIPGKKPRAVPLVEKLLTENPVGRLVFFRKAREATLKQSGGHYPAPLKILELLEKGVGMKREAYLELEARAFSELWATDVSRNLVNLFLMSEAAKRDTGSSLSPEDVAKLPATPELGVLGAGVMGGGIASVSAAVTGGIHVRMKDLNYDAIAKGLAHARGLYDREVQRKRLKPAERDRRMARIRGQTDWSGFQAVDLVIEAVVENIEVKKKVFAELEGQVRPDAVIATNTSSLRMADMQAAFKDPSRFIGLHFFNPVHKMPLVEVITVPASSPESVARGVAYVKALGKTPIVCKDGPGFLVNRLLMPWLNEAAWCLWEGYPMAAMEKALKEFGMPMGPFELLDEVGLDVSGKVGHILHKAFGDRAAPAPVLDKILAEATEATTGRAKRLGRKSGRGFYLFDKPGGRKQELDPKILELLFAGAKPSAPEFTPEALVRRMIYPMINEAAIALEEGIVSNAAKVDLAMIFGTGFPPFRGGLLRFADGVGVAKIVAELDRLSEIHGARLKPSPALRKVADGRGRFYS